jgi:peptidyl-dipeptidase A
VTGAADGAVALLDAAEARLAPLERAAYQATWTMACAATPEHREDAERAAVALDLALADPDLFTGAERAERAARDDVDRRRAVQLRLMTGSKQRPRELIERIVALETELSALHSTHRATIRGERVSGNEIDEIMRTSTDPELRHEAWEASKSVGARVDRRLRELARLRNEAARRAGFRDHYAMALAFDELDEDWLYGVLDRLDADLAAPHAAELAAIEADVRARLGLAPDGPLAPWQVGDVFFQEPPSPPDDPLERVAATIDILGACRRYYADLGHDLDAILARSDLYPREAKDQHAFQMTVDRGRDIRTLCNIVPSLRWLETMLHELGHASYDDAIDPGLPWLVRTIAHTFTTEAIAMLQGRQARDATFLVRYAGVDEAVATSPVNGQVLRRRLHVLVPWVQVMARFERALYADPDGDLATTWWDLVERHQGVARPDGERPHDWAAKIHLAVTPVYYHNYLLGELLASQLEAMLARETGSASLAEHPAEAGRLLRERLTRHGARLRWDELIAEGTGEPLDPRHLVAFLSERAHGARSV